MSVTLTTTFPAKNRLVPITSHKPSANFLLCSKRIWLMEIPHGTGVLRLKNYVPKNEFFGKTLFPKNK